NVIPVSFVGGNTSGRSVRLLEQPEFFQFTHHVSNRRRTPARRVRKIFRDRVRSNCLTRDQVLANDCGQNCLPAYLSARPRTLMGTRIMLHHWLSLAARCRNPAKAILQREHRPGSYARTFSIVQSSNSSQTIVW